MVYVAPHRYRPISLGLSRKLKYPVPGYNGTHFRGDSGMKWFLILWFLPVSLIGAWYGLSYHDINFGFLMLSRQVHDMVFQIYGNMLGMEPEAIPPLLLKAIILDSFILLGIAAFRWRRSIAAWIRVRYAAFRAEPEQPDYPALSADAEDSLSSAP